MSELDKDREVIAAATPGPWYVDWISGDQVWAECNDDLAVAYDVGERNTPFITRARTRYPELVEEVSRLRAENKRLRRCVGLALNAHVPGRLTDDDWKELQWCSRSGGTEDDR